MLLMAYLTEPTYMVVLKLGTVLNTLCAPRQTLSASPLVLAPALYKLPPALFPAAATGWSFPPAVGFCLLLPVLGLLWNAHGYLLELTCAGELPL